MKKTICMIALLVIAKINFAQPSKKKMLTEIQPIGEYENISSQKLFSDTLVSSFIIWIKKEVKPHQHLTHSEHVYILEGEGETTVGNESYKVKSGDIIFIPKNTTHSLKTTSAIPIKVLSVQAPQFDGKDRVVVE